MICKKCGRKYNDDMPKCLWCDAPNEGPDQAPETEAPASNVQQSAIVQDEPENVVRGKSAILWTKIFLAICVFTAIVAEYTFYAIKPFLEKKTGTAPIEPPSITSVLGLLSLMFLSICLGIVSLVAICKFCTWLYNCVKFLRKYTSTKFSPVAAVFCTIIPGLCGFFDYFIFKDILAQQKKVLTAKSEKYKTHDKKILASIPILTALAIISSLLSTITPARITYLVLSVFTVGAYIKTMETIIENEKSLYAMRERILLERKIDEILAQRGKQ